ncbi:MAG TPA: NADH:flavin oxidoreductase/NADH oxidase [Candidatus Luteococcus avicola]|nr:NADH:flavin oxidoreductase/NADH oxidase [Candidatus Luteococcus avicola]
MSPLLFQPITLRDLTVKNRIWVAPMCQYSVDEQDGVPTDWHLVHLGAFAQGGFGLVLTEATAVSPEGRISPQDTGLWNDEQVTAWHRITDFAHSQGAAIGVQLAHAGRKASTLRGFPGEPSGIATAEQGGWPVVGPSALAFDGLLEPTALDESGLDKVVDDFRAAALRAKSAGFDVVEVHAAHGYLLHQFLSPLSNQRTDEYGGDFDNRIRLLLRVVDAVREVWTSALFVRLSATDWVPGQGWDEDQSVELSRHLREHGVDLVDVSTGGNVRASIPVGPGYQVRFAEAIRQQAQVPTGAVGLITEPVQAEQLLVDRQADVVLLARAALREPHWPQRAAHELGLPASETPYPPQHVRGAWA